MNKNKLILSFLLLVFVQFLGYSQLLNLKMGSDALVEEAIKDAIVLVDVKYCIQEKETGQKYGRNGEQYFNHITTVGCKTDKGIVMSKASIEPWSEDRLFDKYRNNDKYEPVLEGTLAVNSTQNDSVETLKVPEKLIFNNDSTLVCIGNGEERIDGLTLSEENNNNINWIVWLKKSESKDSKGSAVLDYTITKKTVEFSNSGISIDAPNFSSSYLGGLYVSAKVVSVGLVEFDLTGFIVEESGKWKLEPVNFGLASATQDGKTKEIETPSENGEDGDLTPVKDNDKDSKNKKKKPKSSKKK